MWLLEPETRYRIERAERDGYTPPESVLEKISAAYTGGDSRIGDRLLTVADGTAIIQVHGTLTKRPSIFAMMFGGGNVGYPELVAAINTAEDDPRVGSIVFDIDSPGGQFDGLFDVLAAIQAAKKPTRSTVSGMAVSGAYAIASQTDEIVATSPAALFGSIGVAATVTVRPEGVNIASTAAPKKRPDVTTDEGVAIVREQLDAMHDLFVEAIATGRGITPIEINKNYGEGATLLAADALARGMIDRIDAPTNNRPRSGGGDERTETMDLATLQAQHPGVYAAAVQIGVDNERDRVTAHLIMGETAGAMDTAVAAVKNGDAMTATLQATYLTAGLNRRDQEKRQQDDKDPGASGGDADDVGAVVVAKVAELIGGK